jgi:hypothetical protein
MLLKLAIFLLTSAPEKPFLSFLLDAVGDECEKIKYLRLMKKSRG